MTPANNNPTPAAVGHTPGPWKCELFYENGDKSSEVIPKNYKTSELHEPICIIPHDDVSEDSEPQMLANVRLIVAAPEMFALLVELTDIEGPLPGNAEWARKVKKLLSKVSP